MIGVLPMKKLNETSVTMDISGVETDVANAKSIIDAINAGEVADAPIDPEMPEELDFNTDVVPDEFSDDTIGVEDDVVPEMDEDDKLLLEDDPIEDSETIIADLIKDGATTTTDIDGAIRECCELIGESADNIDFGKIHQLVEGLERQPDLFDDYYDVAYKNGRKLYTFGEIDQAMRKLLPNWAYSGDAYDGEELNLIYYPHSGVHFTQEDFDALKSGIKERFGNDVRVRFARSSYAPEQKKIYIGFLDAADEEKLDECSGMISEDTIKQGSSWVNKGKEGTHGKFKTKKEADAQRKAMFASGYKAESANEIPDFDALCEAAMRENDFDKSYEEIYDLLVNGNIDEYRKEIQKLGRYGAEQYREWASEAGIDEGDLRLDLAVPENSSREETDEDFENLFSQLVNGNLDIYRQKLQALGRDGVKAYVSWASDNGIPVEELKLQMGLNETSNPDCNYGVSPNPYLKGCKKTPCKMNRVKGFAARDKEQEGFPLRKDDGLSPKVIAIKESAENMLASARSDAHKEAIVRRMADKLLAEGISYSEAIKMLSDK